MYFDVKLKWRYCHLFGKLSSFNRSHLFSGSSFWFEKNEKGNTCSNLMSISTYNPYSNVYWIIIAKSWKEINIALILIFYQQRNWLCKYWMRHEKNSVFDKHWWNELQEKEIILQTVKLTSHRIFLHTILR